MHPLSDRDQVIEHALRGAARSLAREVRGGWRLIVANGALTPLHARIVDEDWLVVTAAYGPAGDSWWPLLERNAGLSGSARLVRAIGGDVEVRAELFVGTDDEAAHHAVDGDSSTRERVAAMCDDVLWARHEAPHSPADDRADALAGPSFDAERVVKLCGDAGWSATARASGEVHVTLDASAAGFQATLTLDAASRLRAVVPMTTSPVKPGACRDAISLLLIEAGAHLRTVKGRAIPAADVGVAGIAVASERLATTAASIDRALTALSVGCRTVGREVQALQDECLARAYLTLRRPRDATRAPTRSHTNHTEEMPCLQLPS